MTYALRICCCGSHDGDGTAVVNGRTWRWEFSHYFGPTFLNARGEPLKRQPSGGHPVWAAFEAWHKALPVKTTPAQPLTTEPVPAATVR